MIIKRFKPDGKEDLAIKNPSSQTGYQKKDALLNQDLIKKFSVPNNEYSDFIVYCNLYLFRV